MIATTRRSFLGLALAAPAVVAAGPPAAAAPQVPQLTNLDHLTFLLDEVPLPSLEHHSTYDGAAHPTALAPWTYADFDGTTFTRVGGGTLDPTTGHYSQGAFNADDISRAAVVYLRAWQATSDGDARERARQLLRSLTYLQNDGGPNAGRVVLWQQADGTLNPSAEPVELPDPSDSAESYWLARTVWALGEGYAAFGQVEPAFAGFLRDRLDLALTALEQESLSRVGTFVTSDGVDLPAWLIVGGADATAEAVLGLVAAHATDPQDRRVADALDAYASGIKAMGTTASAWPFGAILPWTGSLGFWHAWGGAAPEALARAGALLGREDLVDVAVADAGSFTPLVLASGGPHNAWAPVPGEAQIAYGAHGRVAGALATAEATGGPGLREIVGLAAGWFFGANPANEQVYDPATGVTVDGIETDGRINRNSGAESTIHAQLTMMLLDDNPDLAALATSLTGIVDHDRVRVLEAESARRSPGCTLERPETGAWTGEGNLSGGAYLNVPPGEWVEFDVSSDDGDELHPIVWLHAQTAGRARWEVVSGPELGTTEAGGTGDAGLTEAPGALLPLPLKRPLPAGDLRVRCTSEGDLRLDGLLVRPAVATAHYRTNAGSAVLYANAGERLTRSPALADGSGRAYTVSGAARGQAVAGDRVRLVGGGFSVTT
ncbi:hypothetical protein GCM10023169_36050 [Georgenia halophila]|uniref:Uncharacterized protein n=1 Tax=Georgenia halophila TaxID=620889 RepID=A0ABP8LMA4_9MICO